MRPDKNGELLETIGKEALEYVDEESSRRNQLALLLDSLSDNFERKIGDSSQIIDPTMFARLFAISQVQRTQIGLSGFDPMSAINTSHNGIVMAKIAPHHDEYEDDGLKVYKTRVLEIDLPEYAVNSQVNIFGINIYRDDTGLTHDEGKTPGLVIVSESLRVSPDDESISGDTSIFAVINKDTKDAKVYLVTHHNDDDDMSVLNSSNIQRKSAHEMIVKLPDGHSIKIQQLTGDLELQAISEIEASDKVLNDYQPDELSAEEKMAATVLTKE